MKNSDSLTLGRIKGELSTITVEVDDDAEHLVVHVATGPMVFRAVEALRRAYPTNVIRTAGPDGNFMHIVQTAEQFESLKAVYGS